MSVIPISLDVKAGGNLTAVREYSHYETITISTVYLLISPPPTFPLETERERKRSKEG